MTDLREQIAEAINLMMHHKHDPAMTGNWVSSSDDFLEHADAALSEVGPLLAAKEAETQRANRRAAEYCRLYQDTADQLAAKDAEIARLQRDMEIRDEGIDREAVRLKSERDAAESSRRDWAAEAMRLDVELDAALAGRRRLVAEIRDALDLIEKLTDPDPCDHFDHHGACQTHGSDPGQCHHEAARRFLAGFSRPVCAIHEEGQ